MENLIQLAGDINRIAAWLALDDFGHAPLRPCDIDRIGVIALMGNQVVPTLTAACTLAQEAPRAALLFSGGIGHATAPLLRNLRDSEYGRLFATGAIQETMPEAEICAAIARQAFALSPTRMLIENRSTNGGENARFSIQLLRAATHRTVLILQDPTMQRRALLTWRREADLAGADLHLLSHSVFVAGVEVAADGGLRLSREYRKVAWEVDEFVGLVLGEIVRLQDDPNGYGPRGKNFLPHVDIPGAVLESYRRISGSRLASLARRKNPRNGPHKNAT